MSPRFPPASMSAGDLYPDLIIEWSTKLNNGETLFNFRKFSGHKAWWVCSSCDHEWATTIVNRTKNKSGCPKCSVIRRANDQKGITKTPKKGKSLAERNPEIVRFWHPSNDLKVTEVGPGSEKTFMWLCDHGHITQTGISKKIIDFKRLGYFPCQECYLENKHIPSSGKSLAEKFPNIATAWHPSKNGDLTPSDVYANSNSYVWWLCDKGHSSEAMINSKVNGFGCKYCRPKNNSKIEALFREAFVNSAIVSNVDSDPVKLNIAWRVRQVMTVDIVGQLSDGTPVAIEYDGMYYHQQGTGPDRDMAKTKALLKAGYIVIRIRERDLFNLKIKHSNLLQINHYFKRNDLYSRDALVGDTVAKIETWLTSFIA